MSRVILGVAGGIAAYKACELVRRLRLDGHSVRVIPTASALQFVGEATWAALSGEPVHTDVWSDAYEVPHVALGQEADLVVIAPATADLMARAATGRADDLLTNVLLTARCPVLFAPAMHTEMWQHAATRANVATLRSRGVVVLDPASGQLTGADRGEGRLPEPAEIFSVASSLLSEPTISRQAAARDLTGLRVAISAGGTREFIDPVRFIGNSSSGLMGWSLARAAALRGAEVTLVAANVSLVVPPGVEVRSVVTTADLADQMGAVARDADVVVMAAAPADFAPGTSSDTKIKKTGAGGLELSLRQTTDILAGLVAGRSDPRQVIVGFAAETAGSNHDALLQLGREKLVRKGCDLLVLNEVGRDRTFGQSTNEISLLSADEIDGPYAGTKDVLAHRIWDSALGLRARK